MADGDAALPVEGGDNSSHSEARSYSFDTIRQVLIQLAYNLQERRYGGGRGGPRREEGGYEDMLPLSEQLRGSESSLPSYTPLSLPGRINQPRQVCHIGEMRHQPGGSRTPPVIQGVRREERYEPLSEQTVEERRNERRQEERHERYHRRGEYMREDTRREEGATRDEQIYAHQAEDQRRHGRNYGRHEYGYDYTRREESHVYEPEYYQVEERGRHQARFDGDQQIHFRQGERQDLGTQFGRRAFYFPSPFLGNQDAGRQHIPQQPVLPTGHTVPGSNGSPLTRG